MYFKERQGINQFHCVVFVVPTEVTPTSMNVWIRYERTLNSVYYLGQPRFCKGGNKMPNTSGVEEIYFRHFFIQTETQNKGQQSE